MKVVLDAGALIAIDRRDRKLGAKLRVLQDQGTPLRASAVVVGQVWRDGRRQANLARILTGVGIEPVRKDDGRRIGELLAVAGVTDVVDAHVALLADPADMIMTSDPSDIRALLQARGCTAHIHLV